MYNVMRVDIRKHLHDTLSNLKAIHMQHLPEFSCVFWFGFCSKKTLHDIYSINKL